MCVCLTFGAVNLNNVFLNGIMELGLFPGNANLSSGNFLKSDFRRGRDIQAQLVDQDVVWGLAHLPGAVE